MPLPYFQNGQDGYSARRQLNQLVDVANAALAPSVFEGPQGPRGERGLDGIKGDPGTYVGVQLEGVATDPSGLPGTATDGQAYGVESSGSLDVYVWSGGVTGTWTNYGPIRPAEARNVDQAIYLSPSGDDDRDGRTFGKAVSSLEAAVQRATDLGGKTAIFVSPGTYETKGHLDIPDGCSLIGLGAARKQKIIPAPPDEDGEYEVRNVFRLGDGGYAEGFSFEGFRVGNPLDPTLDMENPTEGFAVAFRPGAVINRVPYVHNIVAYRGQTPSLITQPLDRRNGNPAVGPGGGVVIADRAAISEYSAFPNIMTWGATPSVPNSIAYLAKNGAFLNPVNAVCLWAHKHFVCLDGGQMVLSGCSSQFGDYSLWSEGVTYSVTPFRTTGPVFADPLASGAIAAAAQQLEDALWTIIDASFCGCRCPNGEEEIYTRADIRYLLLALQYALNSGDDTSVDQFIRGLFDYKGDYVFPANCVSSYVSWFEQLRDAINNLGLSADTQLMITGLFGALTATLQAPTKKLERSLLTAINHQWTFPLAGVTRVALPSVFKSGGKASRIQRSVIQRNGGRVRYSGQDDNGNAVFVGGLEIDASSGELRGTPFDLGVNRRALRIAIASSY